MRSTLWTGYAMRVLPPCCFKRQNVLSEYFAIFGCRRSPIFPHRTPSVPEPSFIGITVLGNDGGDSLRMSHSQAETCRRAVIEHIDCITVNFQCFREGVYGRRQSIERVRIFSFGRNFSKSEAREVRRDHAIVIGET